MFYRLAKGFTIAFTLIHLMCLPLTASYDGMEYVHLANIIGVPGFADSWNYLRTPLFPALLKISFYWGGEQPQAALLVSAAAGLAGVLLTGSMVRYVAGSAAGGCSLLLLVLYPVLIGYQHMLLTESGIFFFLALLVFLAVRSHQHSSWIAFALAFAIAGGYYWRPTLLYLSPVVAIAFAMVAAKDGIRDRARFGRNVATVLIGPWILASPWLYLSSQYPSDNALETVATGIYKHVLVPPTDPMLGDLGPEYQRILQEETKGRRLAIDGLSIVGEGRHAYLKKLTHLYIKTGLLKIIVQHPARYVLGVTRSFLFFLGIPHHRTDDENWNFSRFIFEAWAPSQNFDNVLNWNRELDVQFRPAAYTGGGNLGAFLTGLLTPYIVLILGASLVTLAWLFAAIRQRDGVVFALTAIPLSLIGLHALTMMSAARYAFPIYPLLLANLTIFTSLTYQSWRKKRLLEPDRD